MISGGMTVAAPEQGQRLGLDCLMSMRPLVAHCQMIETNSRTRRMSAYDVPC